MGRLNPRLPEDPSWRFLFSAACTTSTVLPRSVDGAMEQVANTGGYLVPILRQNSGCARFHRVGSRLVTLTMWSRLMST